MVKLYGNKAKSNEAPKWGVIEALLIGAIGVLVVQFLVGNWLLAIPSLKEAIDAGSVSAKAFVRLASSLSGVALVYSLVSSRRQTWRALGWRKSTSRGSLLSTIPAYIVYFLATNLVFLGFYVLWPELELKQAQNIGFASTTDPLVLAIMFVVLVITPSIVEETIFRGFVFAGLRKSFGFLPSAFFSSLLFGLAHAQLNIVIDTFMFALVLSWLYERYHSLIAPISLHLLKNSIAFTLVFVL